MIKHFSIFFFSLALVFGSSTASSLNEDFIQPPDALKPYCFWYWLNGDISKDGITKDLEAMKKVGIQLAMIGNISGVRADTPSDAYDVAMYSEEWYELTLHAFKEAERLSIELMCFNGPGWSQTGGPWITPERSMRRVTWAEFPAQEGSFEQKVRPDEVPAGQDIAVLALPVADVVTITGQPKTTGVGQPLNLESASWIWAPGNERIDAIRGGLVRFKQEFTLSEQSLSVARLRLTADNSYVVKVNGHEVGSGNNWREIKEFSILPHLQRGVNSVIIEVNNESQSPAGLIAGLRLVDPSGKVFDSHSDASWMVSNSAANNWQSARELAGFGDGPWRTLQEQKRPGDSVLTFESMEPITARGLIVHGQTQGKLYAFTNEKRSHVADISANGGKGGSQGDLMPNGVETFSFPDVTAERFEFISDKEVKVELTSQPTVIQVIEKQLGRMTPSNTPAWSSYIFPETVEPGDASVLSTRQSMINLSDQLTEEGILKCKLPAGQWDIYYFGMVTTGAKNRPAPVTGTGLEVDKMSREHIEFHFHQAFGELLARMPAEHRAIWRGLTIDSYEVGAQNWTDHFAEEFEKRNGYDPILMLPVLTGRVLDSAEASDQFLWDIRRTVADMISEYYVGGLRNIANEHQMIIWSENYGHWGFPGDFLSYGGNSDQVAGEFWTSERLGPTECRAASSSGHIYGKNRIYAEAFTSAINLQVHPHSIKASGERMFTEGINHFVLHVVAHQPRDGAPGKNPGFGTQFHRNTPWFNDARDWVKYLQRCHLLLQAGQPYADVAVYTGDFAPQMTGPANPVPFGYDFDYMGSDALLKNVDVIDGDWVVFDEKDRDQIAGRYRVMALPEAGYIRPHVQARIDELRAKGGRMIDGVPVSLEKLQSMGIAPMVSGNNFGLRWKARDTDEGTIFFLANFQRTGEFEAVLRADNRIPELFNPVTGEIKKMARYEPVEGGTRVRFEVKDRSDSYFVVFREAASAASVVDVQRSGNSVPLSQLDLFYDEDGILTAEGIEAADYELTFSDGRKESVRLREDSEQVRISVPEANERTEQDGFTAVKSIRFQVSSALARSERVTMDLGDVKVFATVTLNGQTFDTLWMPPYTLNVTDALQAGSNEMEVRITSATAAPNDIPRIGESILLQSHPRVRVPASQRSLSVR